MAIKETVVPAVSFDCPQRYVSVDCFGSVQNEDTKAELSDLKEKYEKAEQEKQALSEELDDCKANMKDLADKGTQVRAGLMLRSTDESSVLSI